jgi:hypothetical protein
MRRPAEQNARSVALPLFVLAFVCGLPQIFFPATSGFGSGW